MSKVAIKNAVASQSSQSSISQGEDEYQNRITMLNNNRRQYLKEQQADLSDNDDIQSSDDEDDDDIYSANFAQSNSNPNFGQINAQKAHHMKIQDQNSDSLDDDEDADKPANNKNGGYEYSQSQDDSEQQEEDFNKYPLGKGIKTVRQDSQQDSSEESIDHIEQRIKKLERDLQNRLGKQSNQKQDAKQKTTGAIIATKSHPPKPLKNKSGDIHPKNNEIQNQNKMGKMNENNGGEQKSELKKPITHYLNANADKKTKKQVAAQISGDLKTHMGSGSNGLKKKKPKKQINPESKTEIKQVDNLLKKQKQKQQGVSSSNQRQRQNKRVGSQKSIVSQHKASNQMQLVLAQMSTMQTIMEQLRYLLVIFVVREQNRNLKGEVQVYREKQASKDKDKELLKNRKKPAEQLGKLQELARNTHNSKLDKEIQLLHVIEKLQTKLKKSIQRKLTQNHKPSSSSVTLLHKGLPASFLTNL